MRISRDLLSVEDFGTSLEQEWGATRTLMPSDALMLGLFKHAGAAEWAYRRCTVDFAPVPGQMVTVRKQRHGVRPVAELSTRDRVLYRALVTRWNGALVDPDRSAEAYETFLKAPLGMAAAPKYVVSSDVAACYQYVDHGILSREVLARTGDSEGVDALTDLLAGLLGRSYGLPQQSGPSDTLAEAYLAVIERRLARQGLVVWRYNDDFRIAANTWRDALNAVDTLERECRDVGLSLNDAKTVIRLHKTYNAALGRREELMKEIADEVHMDLTDWALSPYDGDWVEIEPDEDDVTVAAATKVRDEWYDLARRANLLSKDEHEKMAVLTDLLRWAMPVLRTQPTDKKTLRACSLILRTEQTLTPQVSRYLAGADDEAAVTVAWFEKFLARDPYLTPWQVWWVAPSLLDVSGSYASGSGQANWLRSVWDDPRSPEPVKGGLAFTLATRNLVDADELVAIYDGMTETGRPFLARALGAIAPKGHLGAGTLVAEDEWIQWAYEAGKP